MSLISLAVWTNECEALDNHTRDNAAIGVDASGGFFLLQQMSSSLIISAHGQETHPSFKGAFEPRWPTSRIYLASKTLQTLE